MPQPAGPAPPRSKREARHRAALPQARAVHRPSTAARELYVTFVGASGPPEDDLRMEPADVAAQVNEALADAPNPTDLRVETAHWRRDGTCVLRFNHQPGAADITWLSESEALRSMAFDDGVSVKVDPFRRSTYLLIKACPIYNACMNERSLEAIYEDICKHNPAWRGVLVPPTSQPRPFWIGRRQHATSAGLVVAVYDTQKGAVSYRLSGRSVRVDGEVCQVELYRQRPQAPHCRKCLRWGHVSAQCHALNVLCARCGGPHMQAEHDRFAACCAQDPVGCVDGRCTHAEVCLNCGGAHSALAKVCPFYKHRFDVDWWRSHGAVVPAPIPPRRERSVTPPRAPSITRSLASSQHAPVQSSANAASGLSDNRFAALTTSETMETDEQ